MRRSPRSLWSLGLAAALAGCAHDRVVVTAADGPAPPRVERPGLLRAHLRARARARRHAPSSRPQLLPHGTPAIQQPHPEWSAPDHAHELPATIKRRGEQLLLLHGSRLLVVSLADLRLLASVDVGHLFRPTLLVHGDQVLVLGSTLHRRVYQLHSVQRFRVAADGALARLRPLRLRSRLGGLTSHARLVGDALVLQIQGLIGARTPDLLELPQILRRGAWHPLVRAADLQRPIVAADGVHVRVRCGLDDLECDAIGIVAPPAVFLTSDADASFVWTRREVYRFPFADAPVTAVRVPGRPLDLLAWRLRDGDLEAALVTDDGDALVRLPAPLLRAGLASSGPAHLRPLAPRAHEDAPARFVGDRLLRADAPDWACRGGSRLRIHTLAAPAVVDLAVPHCISRIEPVGAAVALVAAAEHDPTDVVSLTTLDPAAATLGETRTYTDVEPSRLRADGPYRLSADASSVALPPRGDAPLRLLRFDGPRIDERSAPGGGDPELAFSVDGRLFVVRGDHLRELAEADLRELRRLDLGPR
ncbi:MAG: hypothetical protein JNL82_23550 [Myxococcales bacterium]|nr:hypothetical protein [Myxococcales bacterium]